LTIGGVFVGADSGLILGTTGPAQGQLSLAEASNTILGGVFVPTTAPTPPLSVASGLFLNTGTGELRLAIASATTLGGVSVATPALAARAGTGGLALNANGVLQLAIAGNAAGTLGGVFVPAPAGARAGAGGLDLDATGQLRLARAGTAAAELGGIFVNAGTGPGLTLDSATGQLSLATAGIAAANLGGVFVPLNGGLALTTGQLAIDPALAAHAYATTPTDNARPITSTILQYGNDPANLTTTAKQIVPAINELQGIIARTAGVLVLVGTFNANTDNVTPITGSPLAAGPLPAPNAARAGYFLIVDTPGRPPAGNAPDIDMERNDLIICVEVLTTPGTYDWAHVGVGSAQITASNVAVTAIPGVTATNVQTALEWLQDHKLEDPLEVDGVSIIGDGQATPLEVDVVDGGLF
jgi:hypothetical protein